MGRSCRKFLTFDVPYVWDRVLDCSGPAIARHLGVTNSCVIRMISSGKNHGADDINIKLRTLCTSVTYCMRRSLGRARNQPSIPDIRGQEMFPSWRQSKWIISLRVSPGIFMQASPFLSILPSETGSGIWRMAVPRGRQSGIPVKRRKRSRSF